VVLIGLGVVAAGAVLWFLLRRRRHRLADAIDALEAEAHTEAA
jgi:LPXTG-motif cell wall-anchored protein